MNLDLVSNLVAIGTVGVSIYLFFADDLRRWSFLGYRPTAVVILFDPESKKCLLVRQNAKWLWHFPQGTVYGSDINSLVNQTLQREVGLSALDFKFVKSAFLGTIKKDGSRKYADKYRSGAISLLPFQGKAYLGCLVYIRVKKKMASQLGYGISHAQVFTLAKALALIDPRKKELLLTSRLLENLV